MAEPISDYGSFFTGAKNALVELDTLSTEEERLAHEESRIRDAIEAENKATNNRIETTLKKRLYEITAAYDAELKRAEKAKSAAETKREKAKNKKRSERIADETKELRENISSTKFDISEEIKKEKLPGICNTACYYTFYFPHKFFDFVKIFLTVVIVFLGIPLLIYKFLPVNMMILLPFIYFVLTIAAGGLYIVLLNATKAGKRDTLIKIRNMRDKIESDCKRIKLITKDINNESGEDRYDLSDFDKEIREIIEKIEELNVKKKTAVSEFENNTKKIITDEILENAREGKEKLQSELELTKQSLDNIADRRSEIKLVISDKYEAILGKDFLQEEKIDALQKIISDKEAANISEAIDIYQSRKNK